MTNAPLSFVTGATGFVGAAVARVLQAKGHQLRLLSRPNNDRRNLGGLSNASIIEGDLGNPETYAEALKDCDFLFHVAADYRIWVPDETAMHAINVGGTESLMRAAQKADIKKIVYTSSVATLGIPKDGSPGTEETPVALDNMIGVYKRSKFLAEEIVRNMIATEGLPATIVSPSTPIGPRDIKPTPTGRIIIEAAAGRMPAYVDTGLNIAHVDDVAMGHWLALKKGKVGERYILGGDNLGFHDILEIIADLTRTKAATIKLPRAPLFPLAYAAELVAHFTKKEPFITVDGLKMAKKKMFFSSDKAKTKLNYAPRPAREAIADAIIWFKENGYLK
ncbi:MAG: NAD-dependent epimerase/dehydratase family protein [Alphaproteobacteria bacterium]|nr:NAD-dependent epimerase/dehydratase family protein [Alphaproteobacteria bacterium]